MSPPNVPGIERERAPAVACACEQLSRPRRSLARGVCAAVRARVLCVCAVYHRSEHSTLWSYSGYVLTLN